MLVDAPKSTLDKLQRVQDNLARVVLQMPRRSHAEPLLCQLHWLPIKYRITYKLAVLTHKILRTNTPHYLNVLLKRRSYSRSLRSSDLPTLDIPRVKTMLASHAFRSAAPKIWNALPRHIITCSSLNSFKKQLKTHLFNIAFNHLISHI